MAQTVAARKANLSTTEMFLHPGNLLWEERNGWCFSSPGFRLTPRIPSYQETGRSAREISEKMAADRNIDPGALWKAT
jgi:hypothetical protein